MKIQAALFLALPLLFCAPAFASDTPWVEAADVVKAADADASKAGIPGIGPHVPALEKVLADGAAAFPPKPGADGRQLMLTDGPAESILAMAARLKEAKGSYAMASPYPEAGTLLAVYYNEVRKPQDALRVIDMTFKLEPVQGVHVGLHSTGLLTEQAAAYFLLKRWADGLASAEAGFKAAQNDRNKARSKRSAGFALVELGRLDDAEAAYNDSLKLEPGNPTAQGELQYIAKLRAGGAKTTPTITTPGSPQ